MLANQVPQPLHARLGPEATSGLLDLVEAAETEWREDVLTLATDRFERRLAEEWGKLRVEMAHLKADLREEMHDGFASVRQDMAAMKFDILKWVFLFWIGQAATVLGFLAMIMRAMQR